MTAHEELQHNFAFLPSINDVSIPKRGSHLTFRIHRPAAPIPERERRFVSCSQPQRNMTGLPLTAHTPPNNLYMPDSGACRARTDSTDRSPRSMALGCKSSGASPLPVSEKRFSGDGRISLLLDMPLDVIFEVRRSWEYGAFEEVNPAHPRSLATSTPGIS